MKTPLRCFISYSHDLDVSPLKNMLAEYDVETFDVYDFSIGESIQQLFLTSAKNLFANCLQIKKGRLIAAFLID